MNAFKKLYNSFKYAFSGVFYCIKTCRNFRIHTVAAAFVVYFSTFYSFSASEKGILYLIIALVLAAECINTSIEQFCNAVTRDFSPYIKKAKDAAAAAVLCVAITSVVIAISLFFDLKIISEILVYFSSPMKLIILLLAIILAIVYIFYEDIFKNAKQ